MYKWLRKVLPEWVFRKKPSRLDHERMYMSVTIGLWVMSLSMIIIGTQPGSIVRNLNAFTQIALAVVIFIGTSIKFHGFISGTRWHLPNRDPRDYYIQAAWGVIATNSGLSVYVAAIFMSYDRFLLSALGGAVGLSLVIGAIWNAWDFINEIHRLNGEFKDEVNA